MDHHGEAAVVKDRPVVSPEGIEGNARELLRNARETVKHLESQIHRNAAEGESLQLQKARLIDLINGIEPVVSRSETGPGPLTYVNRSY